ncbi:MAG: DUF1549 domain-containing protein, partial [Planctomycetaceae bacterium]|nr:DUF1549 domain-containing protein [Planctomycetaceae bacterium]
MQPNPGIVVVRGWCASFGTVVGGLILGVILPMTPLAADDAPEFSPAQIEYFEKHIRPLLAERCQKCHGSQQQKGSLRLDSRASFLSGGDTGPAIVPGHPDDSELIRAIRYEPDGYQMPPDGKLADEAIARLTEWVAMGAPWPTPAGDGGPTRDGVGSEFDLEARSARWSFQPLDRPTIPTVQNVDWCRTPMDRFLLAKLEEHGVTPAPETDRRTWLRRVSFDVIGLPPTPEEVDTFVNDPSPNAHDKVIERLLASPHFGERWGRHWLDLVRYAESRGHEFDHDVANPWHYRDYVIRALNDDVPYDQFVVEHVAGDLLSSEPRASATGPEYRLRLHPDTRGNESILATGFWYLGEWVHSPVDIRQDEADRFENMIDVYSKTFLGLTVACARCHDHKFDPITTKDFYALQGYLQSSIYQQVRFETMEHNRRVAAELEKVRREAAEKLMPLIAELIEPIVDDLDEYLIAARDLIQSGVETYPVQNDVVFADFESGTYDGWNVDYDAFGTQPTRVDGRPADRSTNAAPGNFIASSYRTGDGGHGDEHIGVLTSLPFVIDRSFVTFNVSGGAYEWRTCVLLLVDDDIPHAATGQNDDVMRPVTWDVRSHRGKSARIRVIDNEKGPWGHIAVDRVAFTDHHPQGSRLVAREDFTSAFLEKIDNHAWSLLLDSSILGHWIAHLLNAKDDPSDPFYLWAAFTCGQFRNLDAVQREVEQLGLTHSYAPGAFEFGDEEWETHFSYSDLTPTSTMLKVPDLDARVKFSNDPAAPIRSAVAFPGSIELDEEFADFADADGAIGEPGATAAWRLGVRVFTPTFDIKSGKIYCLIRGGVDTYVAVDSHILVRGPLHGTLVREYPAKVNSDWRWIEMDISRYAGHRAHLEFAPRVGEDFVISRVVQTDVGPPEELFIDDPFQFHRHVLFLQDGLHSPRALARQYQQQFRNIEICCDWFFAPGGKSGTCTLAETDWAIRHPHLFGLDDEESRFSLKYASSNYFEDFEAIRQEMKLVSAIAPAMLDGTGEDEYVFIRGNWKKPGEVVPRRFLEVFGGERMPRPEHGSGRLELA